MKKVKETKRRIIQKKKQNKEESRKGKKRKRKNTIKKKKNKRSPSARLVSQSVHCAVAEVAELTHCTKQLET